MYVHTTYSVVIVPPKALTSSDLQVLETECLKPQSTVLVDIGLALLKFVSSHRGLTPDLFDEYTRRQYVAKAPDRNPFGPDEQPARFQDFDITTKVRKLLVYRRCGVILM